MPQVVPQRTYPSESLEQVTDVERARTETLDCELTCASSIIDDPFVRCRYRRLRLRGAGSVGTHGARDPFKLRAHTAS